MILYNQQKELIGISNDALDYFGFKSAKEFFSKHKDISELFIKEEGSLGHINSFSWIDFVLESKEQLKITIQKDGIKKHSFVTIEKLFMKNGHYYNIIINQMNSVKTIKPRIENIRESDYPTIYEIDHIADNLNIQSGLLKDIVLDFLEELESSFDILKQDDYKYRASTYKVKDFLPELFFFNINKTKLFKEIYYFKKNITKDEKLDTDDYIIPIKY